MNQMLEFWAKSRRAEDGTLHAHPIACHCLDVAACLHEILAPPARGPHSRAPLDAMPVSSLTMLAALHDIGKFARKFQGKQPDHWRSHWGPIPAHTAYNHALGSYALLWKPVAQKLDPLFAEWSMDSRNAVLRAVAFHHGRPLDEYEAADLWNARTDVFGQAALRAAEDFVDALGATLNPLPLPVPANLDAFVWALSGLVTFADWLGSDESVFSHCAEPVPVAEYWETIAKPRARTAVRQSGTRPAAINPVTGFHALIGKTLAPSPAQIWAEQAILPDAPCLFVLEDLTGSGKTEAALILAHRLMAQGLGDGIYVALPTMATANAMYGRLAASYRRMFASDTSPSLALAHGRRALHPGFTASILATTGDAATDSFGTEDETSSAACASWIADDRRKTFLAHVGVGTIDQALLAVLPSKHATLRQFGLARKILIIDEAHAYDRYMNEELQRLLQFHAMLGGSAIVLSATLPGSIKQGLVKAYTTHAFEPHNHYPLATVAPRGSAPSDLRLGHRQVLERDLKVTRLPDVESAIDRIAAAAQSGAAVAYIRNTVDDAVAAWEALKARGIDATLFHARFAMGDRLAIESDVVERFGPDGGGRSGRVIVATQVIEQSLDLDFDVMVSDLAPVDLLIQRAGRIWRHARSERPVPAPELYVVSPDPGDVQSADWYTDLFPKGSAVYRNHAQLWLSAREIFTAGAIRSPEDIRALVETVYPRNIDAPPNDVPQPLHKSWDEARSTGNASRLYAGMNLLKPAPAYALQGGQWDADHRIPTREGEEPLLLRLARMEDGAIIPWCTADTPARAWALSEVAVRKTRAGDLTPLDAIRGQADALEREWTHHRIQATCVVLAQEDETWRAMLESKSKAINYDSVSGLHLEPI